VSAGIDLTAMYVAHDALRRDLEHLARITTRTDDDPRRILRTAVGWELFKKALLLHHRAEDEALWPALRAAVAACPDDLALLTAMEAEHGAIDPLLAAVDAVLVDREGARASLGVLTDALAVSLTAHLKHEEAEALPLIQVSLTQEQWLAYGQASARLGAAEVARMLPWMLDGATERTTAVLLGQLPAPLRATYLEEWQPAYAALDLWNAPTAG
jgi:iron-sulfur cluster repair protein YtfE (RIC family)